MFIQDPIYGGFYLNDPLIEKLVSTFEVSRLASIKQANLTSMVFPGANHTRFEHSMGTVHLVDWVFNVLKRKAREKRISDVKINELEEDERLLRVAALLHDICAFPFSHVIEFSLRQISRTKEWEKRPDLLAFDGFYKKDRGKTGLYINELNHEKIRDDILGGIVDIKRYYKKYYPYYHIDDFVIDVLDKAGMRENIINIFEKKCDRTYLHQLIDGDIDLDRIDHLARDSYYSGIKHAVFNVERLIESMTIEEGDLTIDHCMGVPQAIHLMASRELLYDSFYNEPVARCYEAMFCRALFRLLVDVESFDIDHIIFTTDDLCMLMLTNLSLSLEKRSETRRYCFPLLQRINGRRPLKLIFELIWPDIRSTQVKTPQDELNHLIETLKHLDRVMEIEKEVAAKAGVQANEVIIHRDHTEDDPRKYLKFTEVPISICGNGGKRSSKELSHYHQWIDDVKEDWKNRWSVRIYAADPTKRDKILKATLQEIPFLERFVKAAT